MYQEYCTMLPHYDDVIMDEIASQITSLTIVYSAVYLDADQRKHQSSASLAFVWGIHRDRWIPRTKGQLRWRHNGRDSVSNHQPHDCLLSRLFRRRSKKTSKLRVTGLCVGNSPGPVNSPHKGPVTRKVFPFDDVIMDYCFIIVVGYLAIT